jgi:hypothetical protein
VFDETPTNFIGAVMNIGSNENSYRVASAIKPLRSTLPSEYHIDRLISNVNSDLEERSQEDGIIVDDVPSSSESESDELLELLKRSSNEFVKIWDILSNLSDPWTYIDPSSSAINCSRTFFRPGIRSKRITEQMIKNEDYFLNQDALLDYLRVHTGLQTQSTYQSPTILPRQTRADKKATSGRTAATKIRGPNCTITTVTPITTKEATSKALVTNMTHQPAAFTAAADSIVGCRVTIATRKRAAAARDDSFHRVTRSKDN